MTVDQQFNTLSEKLQLLLKQHHRIQKENERLKDELQQSKAKESEVTNKLEEMQQQITILKMGSADMNDQDKKDFEKKINLYLKEIDRCIAYLSE